MNQNNSSLLIFYYIIDFYPINKGLFHHSYSEIILIKSAEQSGIHAGWSNPCLEIWLYAYFGNMPNIQDSVSCCKRFAIEYEKRTDQKYDKAEKDLYKKLCEFGNEENAIKIAQQKRKQCIENGLTVPSKMIPCTMIDILINIIKTKIGDNNGGNYI